MLSPVIVHRILRNITRIFLIYLFLINKPVQAQTKLYLREKTNSVKDLYLLIPGGVINGDKVEIRIRHLEESNTIIWDKGKNRDLFKRTPWQIVKSILFTPVKNRFLTGGIIDGSFRQYLDSKYEIEKNIITFTVYIGKGTVIKEKSFLYIKELIFQSAQCGEFVVEYKSTSMKKWSKVFEEQQILTTFSGKLKKEYKYFVQEKQSVNGVCDITMSLGKEVLLDKEMSNIEFQIDMNSQISEFNSVSENASLVFVNARPINYSTERGKHYLKIILQKSELKEVAGTDLNFELNGIPLKLYSSGKDSDKVIFKLNLVKYQTKIQLDNNISIQRIQLIDHQMIHIAKLNTLFKMDIPFTANFSQEVLSDNQIMISINNPWTLCDSKGNRIGNEFHLKSHNNFSSVHIRIRETTDQFCIIRLWSKDFENEITFDKLAFYTEIKNIDIDNKVYTNAGINKINTLSITIGDGIGLPVNSYLQFIFDNTNINKKKTIKFFRTDSTKVYRIINNEIKEIQVQSVINDTMAQYNFNEAIPPHSTLTINNIIIGIPNECFSGRLIRAKLDCQYTGGKERVMVSNIYPIQVRTSQQDLVIVPFLNRPEIQYKLPSIEITGGAAAPDIFTPGHKLLIMIEYKDNIEWRWDFNILNTLEIARYIDVQAIQTINGNPKCIELPITLNFPDTRFRIGGLAITGIQEQQDDFVIKICYDTPQQVLSTLHNTVKIRSPKLLTPGDQYEYVDVSRDVFNKYMIELDISDVGDYLHQNPVLRIVHQSNIFKWRDRDVNIKFFDYYGNEINNIDYNIQEQYIQIALPDVAIDNNDRIYISGAKMQKTSLRQEDHQVSFQLKDLNENLLYRDPRQVFIKRDARDVQLILNKLNESFYSTSSGNYLLLKSARPLFPKKRISISVDENVLGLSDSTFFQDAEMSPDQTCLLLKFDKGIEVVNQQVSIKSIPLNNSDIGINEIEVYFRDRFGFCKIQNSTRDARLGIIDIDNSVPQINKLDIGLNLFTPPADIEIWRNLSSLHVKLIDLYKENDLPVTQFQDRLEQLGEKLTNLDHTTAWWQYWWNRAFYISLHLQLYGAGQYSFNDYQNAIDNAQSRGWQVSSAWVYPPPPEQVPSLVQKFKTAINNNNFTAADDYLNQLIRISLREFFRTFGYPGFEQGAALSSTYEIFKADLYYWRSLVAYHSGDYDWAGIQLQELENLRLRNSMLIEASEYRLLQTHIDQIKNKKGTFGIIQAVAGTSTSGKEMNLTFTSSNPTQTTIKISQQEKRNVYVPYEQKTQVRSGNLIKTDVADAKSLIKTNLTMMLIGLGLLLWTSY